MRHIPTSPASRACHASVHIFNLAHHVLYVESSLRRLPVSDALRGVPCLLALNSQFAFLDWQSNLRALFHALAAVPAHPGQGAAVPRITTTIIPVLDLRADGGRQHAERPPSLDLACAPNGVRAAPTIDLNRLEIRSLAMVDQRRTPLIGCELINRLN